MVSKLKGWVANKVSELKEEALALKNESKLLKELKLMVEEEKEDKVEVVKEIAETVVEEVKETKVEETKVEKTESIEDNKQKEEIKETKVEETKVEKTEPVVELSEEVEVNLADEFNIASLKSLIDSNQIDLTQNGSYNFYIEVYDGKIDWGYTEKFINGELKLAKEEANKDLEIKLEDQKKKYEEIITKLGEDTTGETLIQAPVAEEFVPMTQVDMIKLNLKAKRGQ